MLLGGLWTDSVLCDVLGLGRGGLFLNGVDCFSCSLSGRNRGEVGMVGSEMLLYSTS